MTVINLPPHGTLERHTAGCHCAACVIAAAHHDNQQRQQRRAGRRRTNGIPPSRLRTHTLPGGQLSVYCWCKQAIVYAPRRTIAACRTESCGRDACRPEPT